MAGIMFSGPISGEFGKCGSLWSDSLESTRPVSPTRYHTEGKTPLFVVAPHTIQEAVLSDGAKRMEIERKLYDVFPIDADMLDKWVSIAGIDREANVFKMHNEARDKARILNEASWQESIGKSRALMMLGLRARSMENEYETLRVDADKPASSPRVSNTNHPSPL